jgi:SRSO17 transposase
MIEAGNSASMMLSAVTCPPIQSIVVVTSPIGDQAPPGDLAFFTTWCPAGTSIETLVAVEGHRWAIEDSFETAKNEFGLDHNESRSWHGWHRHVSLAMLAFAMMAAIRHRANPPPPKKTKRRPPAKAKA